MHVHVADFKAIITLYMKPGRKVMSDFLGRYSQQFMKPITYPHMHSAVYRLFASS